MNKHVKNTLIFTGLFGMSFGIAFFSQYKKPLKEEEPIITDEPFTPVPESDQQKVLNSLLEIKGFEVDGDLTMIGQDNNVIGASFYGLGDLTDLDNIKLKGNIDVNLNSSHLLANFGYFDSELYFDYHESYFKLETEKLLDFIKLLPTSYDIGVSLPSEIENLDLGMVEEYINDMSDKKLTPDGKNYYFTLDLSDKVSLNIITDLDLKFTGIRTGSIEYEGMIFKLNASLTRKENVELVSPKLLDGYEKYQDFSPAFKLFDGIYSLIKEKKKTVNADLEVRKYDELGEASYLLGTNLDITYNLEEDHRLFALYGNVITKRDNQEYRLPYDFSLFNKNIYAKAGDVAISIELDSVTALIDYVLDKIGDEKIKTMIESMTDTISASEVTSIIEKANGLLGTIILTSDELGINLNTSNFSTTKINEETGLEEDDLSLSDMYVAICFDEQSGALNQIKIKNFQVNNYEGDLVLTFNDYVDYTVDPSSYQKIDHLISIATFYDLYKDMNKFRIEFDANISKDDEEVDGNIVSYNDITIDGGLQFELDPERNKEGHTNIGYGYGDLSIKDRKNVYHNIKADMKNVDEILLSYSTIIGDAARDNNTDPMNIKFKIQTLKDLVNVISDVVKNPDEHLEEIIGAISDKAISMPIMDVINGDYLLLLQTNLIDRFEVGSDYIEIDIAMDILSFVGESFTLRIDFVPGEYGPSALKGISISNLSISGLHINFNAELKEFDDSLESSRLSPAEEYIDFSDAKVLLELGINTSKNNYYHFTANANLKINLFNINFDIPLDIKVWTNHGDVKVSVDFTKVPAIVLVNGSASTKNRVAHVYYHDKTFYVNRSEDYTELLFIKYHEELVAKYSVDQFLDNILDILCGDILCLKELWLNMINDAVEKNSTEGYQMKYENILNDFLYVKSGHYFYFDINLAEIANNKQLEYLTLKVLTDNSDTNLSGLTANLSIKLTDTLGLIISLDLSLADCSIIADSSNNLYELDAFEARLADKELGYKEVFKTRV